ncbi:high affinity immunoglobulin gamma Fc receptor I-like [Sphaeramia orbicularis]|uniref:high affinity immunoglobulin gamma Fc receptor I-like n=1 Tax=Sphaeramia orbicularis TaxID=375764 RepID=UPI00117D9F99|nr:high affinity immunoglobulin gamma Fc receptor I-like [Sphaeramia orbicularis]
MAPTSVFSLMSLLSCTTTASLKVSPNWSQFFKGQSVSLSCEDEGPGWTLRRNTSTETRTQCGTEWGRGNGSSCRIRTLFSWDSGVYWCESSEGQTRTSISLSVTGGPLVLHSPVLPVMEGQEVSLHCQTHPPSNRSADFYKDGVFVGVGPAGHMTIPQVSLAHQGVYRCDITGVGQSPPSWMSVSGKPTATPPPALAPPTPSAPPPASASLHVVFRPLCFLVVSSPYFVSTLLMVSLYRQRRAGTKKTAPPTQAETRLDDDYDDVIGGVTTEHQF